MTELSGKIIGQYLVRKTGGQKKAFREMLTAELGKAGIEAREEKYRDMAGSVNVIVGDVEKAKLIFGAHYDTCPRMPYPNFITPLNKPLYYTYQMGIVLILVIVSLAAEVLAAKLVSEEFGRLVWFIVYFGVLALMMKGPANPNTYNDNTSGVVTLTELMLKMPEELRSQCAFVYFDNEEMGLMGSGAFRKAHKEQAKNTAMINLDCVGDGGYLLLVASKAFREDAKLYAAVKSIFEEQDGALHADAEKAVYPSDQKKFNKSLALNALNKGPRVGYYMNRIHTVHDTVLKEENVSRISGGLCALAEEYLK
ncbi:MAG: M28 family peptidase [Clostridia bacterium]|nr:M28 family peptidase [Clostridia bacterium]